MARVETVELTNMCMIIKDDQVLVQNRKKSWKGYAFPGGHIEIGESIVDSVIREIKEETGLSISHLVSCGIKNYIYPDTNKRYLVFLYKTSDFTGTLISNEEGNNEWVKISELKNLPLSNGMDYLVDMFLNEQSEELYIIHDNEYYFK